MKKLLVNSLACAVLVGATTQYVMAMDEAGPSAKQTATNISDPAISTAETPEPSDLKEPEAMKVSEHGFIATRAMRAARMAIFNGEPKVCEEMLAKAHEALERASQDEAIADLIPIDGSLTLAEKFVPNGDQSKFLLKANQHFQNGESAKGIEQLKLGAIEVNFSRILLPIEATKQRLADAMSLAQKEKYYDANLALKAAEEGLAQDSIALLKFANDDVSEGKQG